MRKTIYICLVAFTLAAGIYGCGEVEWFPSDTVNNEPTPDAFTLAAKNCQTASTSVQTDDVDITNVTSSATVKITDGEYSSDGGATWGSDTKIFTPSADKKLKIRVRHTTAALTDSSPVKVTILKVGNTTGYFYSYVDDGSTWCN